MPRDDMRRPLMDNQGKALRFFWLGGDGSDWSSVEYGCYIWDLHNDGEICHDGTSKDVFMGIDILKTVASAKGRWSHCNWIYVSSGAAPLVYH